MNSDDIDDDLNHIDDAIEDFEEDWDDEPLFDEGDDSEEILSEQDNVEPSKKAKNSGKSGFLIIGIGILAGLAYAIYPILIGNNSDSIPVVKLENTETAVVSQNNNLDSIDQNSSTEEESILMDTEDTSPIEAMPEFLDVEEEDILTPMVPDNDIVLHDLDALENGEDEFFDDNFDELEGSLKNDIGSISEQLSVDDIDANEFSDNEDLQSNFVEADEHSLDLHSTQDVEISEKADIGSEEHDELILSEQVAVDSSVEEKVVTRVAENIDAVVSSDKSALKEEIVEEKPVQVEKPKVIKKPVWIIRAAQPGRAVIFDKTTGEIKSVEVGNTVNGIGKVKTISKSSSGKWVVQGTLGSIK